jgi:predicted alpha/beta hydrolase
MTGIRKEEILVVTKDGVASKATLFTADYLPLSAPVLICMPAMGVSAKYYEPLAGHMLKEGWRLVTADMRGNGLCTLRVSKEVSFGYHEIISFDWPAVVEKVQELFPGAPRYLFGHSLGGLLGSLCLSANPQIASGLIFVAAHSAHFKGWDFPFNLYVLVGTQAACVIASILGYFPGKKIGFGGNEARGVICDWARQARTGRCEPKNGKVDYEKMLGELEIPILAFSFEGDLLSPKRAVENLCSKMKRSQLTHIHLEEANVDHFAWVRNPDPIIRKIREWLDKQGQSKAVSEYL